MSFKKGTYNKIALIVGLSTVIMVVSWLTNPVALKADPHYNNIVNYEAEPLPLDSPEIDLPYPFKDGVGGPKSQNSGGLYLKNPSNVKSGFEYDPETGTYNYFKHTNLLPIKQFHLPLITPYPKMKRPPDAPTLHQSESFPMKALI